MQKAYLWSYMNIDKIWYLDDDEDDLFYFDTAFQKLELKIDLQTFSNPEKFIEKIHELSSDASIVFLDINMGRINGFHVLKQIRNNTALLHLPVIMYSTSSDDKTFGICKEMGASAYVVKPTDINKLTELIRSVLSINWSLQESQEFKVLKQQ